MATTSSRVQKLFASVKTADQLNELLDLLEKASVERASALGLESKGGVYVQPAGKPRTVADEPSKPAAAPKPPTEYRRLQAKAKALGINATGTKDALKARVEWAESGKPVMATAANGPSPAPAVKKRSKPAAPAPKLKPAKTPLVLLVHDTDGTLRPATPEEIRAAYGLLPPVKKAS
jgi:hypothetical protein